MFLTGWSWLTRQAKKAHQKGEGYGEHNDNAKNESLDEENPMPVWLAFSPLILVLGLNALFTYVVFPTTDFSGLSARYADLDPSKSAGIWAIITSLVFASIWLIVVSWSRLKSFQSTINKGALGSMLPAFNTASEVGYGAVIASLAGFVILRDLVLNVSPNNPLISEAIAMSTLAGITGSSSGGLSIALQTLGADYLQLALENNISPELLHRVAVIAAGGFDTLPHCGAIITLLSICGMNHRQSYLNIAAVTIIGPMLALVVVITLGTIFGSF